jgi:hypothetical protein
MSGQIPGIPQAATGTILVNHINDRLRRISQELGPGATGKQGIQGIPGTSSGTLTAGEAAYANTVTSATLTPDLTKSNIQQVVIPGASTTASASSGASSITVASATGIAIGELVQGAGIAAGSLVGPGYAGGTTVPLTINTTGILSTTPVTFSTTTIALTQPSGLPTGSFSWSLVADNSNAAACALIPDGTYGMAAGVPINPGTRTVLNFVTTQSGNTTQISVVANQAIIPL